MSDINPGNGILLPGSFVHVTCLKEFDDPIIKCTCEIYKLIKCSSKQKTPLWPVHRREDEEEVPDHTFTCLHCRFYRQFLVNAYDTVQQGRVDLTPALKMVHESMQHMNLPIQLVGNVLLHCTTKFSVKGDDSYSIVHFTFHQGKCYAKCSDALCCTKLKSKKRIVKKISLKRTSQLCSHRSTVYDNFDFVKKFFPDYFNEDEGEEGQEEDYKDDTIIPHPDIADVNTDDIDLHPDSTANFDVTSGLWTFSALSTHKPYENMFDPKLIHYTQLRNDVNSSNFNPETGLYTSIKLQPETAGKTCACGAGFGNSQPQYKGRATLYTRMGAVECLMYSAFCEAGQCESTHESVAKEMGIFFTSGVTCLGDEMGWDFISLVKKTKISFTGYCGEMTRRYRSNNVLARDFISPNTFIRWFFGWLSAFQIDFRKHVDPWCEYSPEVLACDGTHIGVAVKNLYLQKPVTGIDDKDKIVKAKHKRYDRVIIINTKAREQLNYICKERLGKLTPKQVKTPEEVQARNNALMEHLTNIGEPVLEEFINIFLQQNQDEEVLNAMLQLLYMLSGDASMSTVAPPKSWPFIAQLIDDLLNGRKIQKHVESVEYWCREIAQLLVISAKHECLGMAAGFCVWLMKRIELVHKEDEDPQAAQEIPHSYNPPSGKAYYFTKHRNQLRKMPEYVLDGQSKKKTNYDDDPLIDDYCSKKYPLVSC